MALQLIPTPRLNVAPTGSANTWCIAQTPASMELQAASSPIPSGWVLLRGRLRRRGQDFSATLTAEAKGGAYSYPLPVTGKGTIFELMHFPEHVLRLMLEPMRSPGEFELQELSLESVGQYERIVRMWRRVLPMFFKLPGVRRHQAGLLAYTPFINLQKAYRIAGQFRAYAPAWSYREWLRQFGACTQQDRLRMRKHMKTWLHPPRFDIMVVAGTSQDVGLARTLKSLRRQVYRHVRVTVVLSPQGGDNTAREHFPPWVAVVKLGSEADWRRLNATWWTSSDTSTWVCFVRPGSALAEHALYWIASEAVTHPRARLIYSDHDYFSKKDGRIDPMFKPDWSPELLRSTNYIGCSGAVRADTLAQAGGLSLAGLRAQDSHDLLLRVSERLRAESVRHIPAVLWHLPALQGAPHRSALPEANPVAAHLTRVGVAATVEEPSPGCYRVRYRLPSEPPLISIVVPTRDAREHLRACVESVLGASSYRNVELIVVDNQSVEPQTLTYLTDLAGQPRVRVMRYARPFNYSAINNFAVAQAAGQVVCLLNNDTEVITPDWMEEMLGHLIQPGVGVVGAKLLFRDGRVQHGGDTVGPGGCANHLHYLIERDAPGYCGRAKLAQDLSAVTAACLMTWRDLYLNLGGLDERNLPVAFNDVDYCLRAREAGYRVVWTPYAELYHYESISRRVDDTPEKAARARRESAYMRKRWRRLMRHDPFYNPNLSYERPDFSLSSAPMVRKPWL